MKELGRNFGRSSGSTSLGFGTAGRAGGTVALGELVHAAGSVDEALFTREIGVAGGADTDLQVLDRGKGVVDLPASAGDGRFESGGMGFLLHNGN